MILDVFEYNQHFVAMMNVINAAKLNPPKRGHKHHIIPKCWYKMNNLEIDNSKNNLVLLTKADHIKVHKLAALCSKTKELKNKMLCSVCILEHRKTNVDLAGYNHPTFGRHQTDEAKQQISKAKAEWWKNHENTWQDKCAEARKGKKRGKYKLTYTSWKLDENGKRIYY